MQVSQCQVLHAFVTASGYDAETHELVMQHPKLRLSEIAPYSTLLENGITAQSVIFVQEK